MSILRILLIKTTFTTMAFIPRKKATSEDLIKSALLNGKIVRYDSNATYVEVIERERISQLRYMGNVGTEHGERITIGSDSFHAIKNELSEEYDVIRVRCEHSGCCQYSAFAIYLNGDEC